MTVLTLTDRKKARVEAMREAFSRLREDLAAYGERHGGRFWLYGSAASDTLRYDSDIDILADFEETGIAPAIVFAEAACVGYGLKPDIRARSSCTLAFIDRISARALILP